jgi:hypothetical protein
VHITVDTRDDYFETTFHEAQFGMGTGWAPGDQTNQQITIANTGSLDVIYTVYMDYQYNPGDIWRCDPNGNNLHVSATPETGVIAAGGTQQVMLNAEMPLAAGNDCQGKTGNLRVTVHAVQARNIGTEFKCVKLVYKDQASKWLPYGDGDPLSGNWKGQHGNVCYKVDANNHLRLIVNAYSLTHKAYNQQALNGQGGCAVPESIVFAGMTNNLYHSGWSNGSTTALANSCSNTWDEGVYNFNGTDGELKADNNGNFSADLTLDGAAGTWNAALPTNTYNNVKFIVKEIQGANLPSHANHGNNWPPMLMEIRALNFQIP